MNVSSNVLRYSRGSRHTNPSDITYQVSAKSRKNVSEGFFRESNSFTECKNFPRCRSCLNAKKPRNGPDAPNPPDRSNLTRSGNWALEKFNNSGFRRTSPQLDDQAFEIFNQKEELKRTKRETNFLNYSNLPPQPVCGPKNPIHLLNNSELRNKNLNCVSMPVIDEILYDESTPVVNPFNSSIQQNLYYNDPNSRNQQGYISEQKPGYRYFHNSLAKRESFKNQSTKVGFPIDENENFDSRLERSNLQEQNISIRPINYNILDKQYSPFGQSNNNVGSLFESNRLQSDQLEKPELGPESLERSVPSSKHSVFVKYDQGFDFFNQGFRDNGPAQEFSTEYTERSKSKKFQFFKFESSIKPSKNPQKCIFGSAFNPS